MAFKVFPLFFKIALLFSTIENKLRDAGGGMGEMGDRDEGGHACDEHRMMYGSDDSLKSTPETKIN